MTDLGDFIEALVKTIVAYCESKQGKNLPDNLLTEEAQRILRQEAKEIEREIEDLIQGAGSRVDFMNAMKELLFMIKNTLSTHNPEALLTLRKPILNFYLGSLTLQKQAQNGSLNLQLDEKTITHKCKGHLRKGYVVSSLSEMGVCVDTYLIKSTRLYLISESATHDDIKNNVVGFVEKMISSTRNTMLVSSISPILERQEKEIGQLKDELSKTQMKNKRLEVCLNLMKPKQPQPFFGNIHRYTSLFGLSMDTKIDLPNSPEVEDIDISL